MSTIKIDNLGLSPVARQALARAMPALANWLDDNEERWSDAAMARRCGDFPTWRRLLAMLPPLPGSRLDLSDGVHLTSDRPFAQAVEAVYQGLHPWRKGPYRLGGLDIDSEWRSDMKWARLADSLPTLGGQRVIDVGGGNGYFSFRLCAFEPSAVVCLEPTGLCWAQHMGVRMRAPSLPLAFVPLSLEQFDAPVRFDVVLSLGVIYHNRQPLDHLQRLRRLSRPGGRLFLESLVMPEEHGTLQLKSGQRYAMMRNVWCVPSASDLSRWLGESGFDHVRLIDLSQTTSAEQRSTAWMRFHSLADFLEPTQPQRTVEGLPAPRRALFEAQADTP
ncbi:MAG: tRNA 5-methoxyuridine(34)/uridine 5-oxyacetic acid(34) synthase CmoB [Proteobacteria bacterium]|nr:tRNA 5-methoxyuridine(34)/uridine 5-oxyacetic acid(34) synthase CmoB [Pseudomonadota bacterium]